MVLTTELPDTYRLLGRTPRRPVALKPAPSAVVAHLGCRAVEDRLGHHNIVFGQAWEQTFRDVIDEGRVMGDPSLLVTRPTAGDPSLAPAGRDLLYVLAPAPNTVVGAIDWARSGRPTLSRSSPRSPIGCPPWASKPKCCMSSTRADGRAREWSAGTPFALAHTFAQTGPFRPANTVRGICNVVLAGSSTVPGVGVPTALLSGRLAADRVTGVVRRPVAPRAVQK